MSAGGRVIVLDDDLRPYCELRCPGYPVSELRMCTVSSVSPMLISTSKLRVRSEAAKEVAACLQQGHLRFVDALR